MNTAGPSNSPTPGPFADPGEETDAQLSARLKQWTGATPALHPVGELLDRHWAAAFAYARLCTEDGRAAGMLTTAAFTRLFGEALRQDGPSSAWRPHLLVTVRRIAAEWDTDGRRELLHPALRTPDHSVERAAARLLPPPHRRTLSRAFLRLPQTARCVLWHTEVEAEPPTVPAVLLGLEEEDVAVEVRRALERLRAEVLQVHRESAPGEECRHYLRLLDASYRRSRTVTDPDLRRHLDRCRHCRYTADQLAQFGGDLGFTLAEAVLGWAARDYVEARAANAAGDPDGQAPQPGTAAAGDLLRAAGVAEPSAGDAPAPGDPDDAGHARPAGGPRGLGVVAGHDRPGGVRTDGTSAAGTGQAVPMDPGPLPPPAESAAPGAHSRSGAALAASLRRAGRGRSAATRVSGARSPRGTRQAATRGPETGPGGSRAAARRAMHRARAVRRRNLALAVLTVTGLIVLPLALWATGPDDDGDGTAAGTPAATPGTGGASTGPSRIGAREPGDETLTGQLHTLGSGLCVDVAGGKAVQGAETRLAVCSAAAAQRWSYEPDGLLRNVAAPDLCLDSHLGYSVRLAPCVDATRPGGTDIRYDFTVQGNLVPRGKQDLALAPAATDGSGALVLKLRVQDTAQRWVIDASAPDPQMKVVNWDAASDSAGPFAGSPAPARTPDPRPSRSAVRTAPPQPTGSPAAGTCTERAYACPDSGRTTGSGGYGHGGHRTGGRSR
ncbi:ricin-type beta-trefoil lectin domain protein [Streptomyces actuosus]|uniref:ricin-type beta-trefoil lectin domain protein n=1 Tax=Streptomyces actuosus TaxID=1885 RepID=UPI0027DA2051|nr:ricin-type beta-trefoil lectin domain protein [Streptomyces actuosus]